MRIAITCECPHCHKPIFGQSTVPVTDSNSEAITAVVDDLLKDSPPPIREVVRIVADRAGVSVAQLYSDDRTPHIVHVRNIAWQALKRYGYSQNSIAKAFNRHYSTIHHGVNQIAGSALL